MEAYLVRADEPIVNKSERLWRVTPLVLEFYFSGGSEEELDELEQALADRFKERKAFTAKELTDFLNPYK